MANAQRARAFIGRGAERVRLRAEFDELVSTRAGRTIVIGGEAGIGKSLLVERFSEDVGPYARVLEGACLEVAGDALPYAPFVEMLRALVRDTGSGRLPALLGPGRAELTRLLPELAVRAADLHPEPEPDRASQARLFELVLGVFERLAAERALVLVIEDVQWADRSTRDLVGFLARALRDDPVLIVMTIRTDAAGEAVANLAFIAELEREDHVERLELRPFDRDEVGEQATRLLPEPPEPALIDRLLARTDGNPFYVEELLLASGATEATLPPVLRDVLAARVNALSPPAREILRAAAVAGRRIDDDLLAAGLAVGPRELGAGLREALESGILSRIETPTGTVSQFRHALLQEVVDRELFPGERAALHARFAEDLERRLEGGDRSVAAVEIARHWDGAHHPARALPFMVQAALAAEAVYAYAEALPLWERAARMIEDGAADAEAEIEGRDLPELWNRAADCAALVGEHRRAVAAVQRALVHLYPAGDGARVLALENRLRWHLWWAGERAATVAAVSAALANMADGPTVARARALAQLAAVRMLGGDLVGSAECARQAIEIGERADAAAEIALAHGVLGWDTAMLGDVEGGIAEFRKGQAIAEATGSVEGMAIAATNLAALLDRVGRSEAALEAARAGYVLTERYGVARTFGAILLGHAAKSELALGRWDEAERSTSMGLRRGATDAGAVWLSVNRARLLTGRGRFAEARVLLKRARGIDARLGGTDYRSALIAAEAELGAWTGDLVGVLDRAEEGLALLVDAGTPDPSLAWQAALTLRAIADAGRVPAGARGSAAVAASAALATRARDVASRIERVLAEVAQRPLFASGDRAQALLALLRAESDRAAGRIDAARWREVGERWVGLQRPFQTAYARLREAEAIVASRGSRDAASAALGEAAGIAARLGAEPLAGLVAAFARQARLSLPAGDSGASGAMERSAYDLTAREAEVLRLVAAGWTNQQIAEVLFITRKTASVHVSNVMGKLGAANRGEAAALARRLGVDDAPLPVARD
ncbi:MAG: AAA family ATPase [Candidatus Limnocylindrales bacterium]